MIGINSNDIAYLAGIIDGEGSITISRAKDKKSSRKIQHLLKLSVGNNSLFLLGWIKEKFGGNIHSNGGGENARCFRWCVGCKEAVPILKQVYPHLKIKNKQALVVFNFNQLLVERGFLIDDENFKEREELYIQLKELNKG